MALNLTNKTELVSQLNSVASSALSVVVSDARGVTANDITEVRKQARSKNVVLKIVRNTLAKRAFKGTEFECLESALVGPTLLAFSTESIGDAAKVLGPMSAEIEHLSVRAVAFDGQLMGADALAYMAALPTKQEALACLVQTMSAAAVGLVAVLQAGPMRMEQMVSAYAAKVSD